MTNCCLIVWNAFRTATNNFASMVVEISTRFKYIRYIRYSYTSLTADRSRLATFKHPKGHLVTGGPQTSGSSSAYHKFYILHSIPVVPCFQCAKTRERHTRKYIQDGHGLPARCSWNARGVPLGDP